MNDSGPRLSLVRDAVTPSQAPPDPAPAMDQRSDDELMLLARGGLVEAYEVLVRRYQAAVLRVASRRLRRREQARDVAQNAFLDVYRARERYQPRGQFTAYLFRAVLNQCRMAERSATTEGKYQLALAASVADRAEVSVSGASAEALVLERERERDLERAVGRLSEKLRDVVSLRFGAGLPYEEIAQSLAVPVGTVKRRLFDALEKLRQFMEEPS